TRSRGPRGALATLRHPHPIAAAALEHLHPVADGEEDASRVQRIARFALELALRLSGGKRPDFDNGLVFVDAREDGDLLTAFAVAFEYGVERERQILQRLDGQVVARGNAPQHQVGNPMERVVP